MHKLIHAGLALALVAPAAARADTTADLRALRQELDTLRATYEARLQALEQRLKAAEANSAPQAAAVPMPAPSPAPGSVAAAAPAPARPSAGGANAFNPAISLILSGTYTRTSQDPESFTIGGFHLPSDGEVGPGTRGFSLAESELGFSASIDPWWRGVAAIALHPDDAVSVEEAYVQTTALGQGLTLTAGRFFSGIGYLNAQHAHTWDFVDNPLAYQAMLGTQFGDDGLRVTWLAPTDTFVELGLELGRGSGFPGDDGSRNGAGSAALTAHAGGDLGTSHSWRAGLSVLNAKADGQALVGTAADGSAIESLFTGRTRVWVADAVWKWAPGGNATRTSFKLQGEYLRSRRSGTLTADPAGAASEGDYRVVHSGWYLQGVWQFMPRWRAGLRTERLDPGTPEYGANAGLYAIGDFRPRRNSLMLDYGASEFSRVRLQFAQDRSREGVTDRQLSLQYQMSLGAHGGHSY